MPWASVTKRVLTLAGRRTGSPGVTWTAGGSPPSGRGAVSDDFHAVADADGVSCECFEVGSVAGEDGVAWLGDRDDECIDRRAGAGASAELSRSAGDVPADCRGIRISTTADMRHPQRTRFARPPETHRTDAGAGGRRDRTMVLLTAWMNVNMVNRS